MDANEERNNPTDRAVASERETRSDAHTTYLPGDERDGNRLAVAVVAGTPCCDDPDPCCNDTDPCCGVNCDDNNPCTEDACDGNGECQYTCLPDCGDCGEDSVCFGCGCEAAYCSFDIIDEDGCPGGTVEMQVFGSCNPDCGPMVFSMNKSIQYLEITAPSSIPCDGNMYERTLSVRVDENAPPGPASFTVLGTTPLATCQAGVDMDIVECVDLSFEAVSDDNETDPGGFLCVNDDDDNGDGTPDKDDPGPTLSENDLKSLVLSMNPGWTPVGVVSLQCTGGCDKVRFYENSDRSSPFTLPISWSVPHPDLPKTLYVEGIKNSTTPRDVEIRARFLGGGTMCTDIVKLTVVQVDLDVDSDNTSATADFGPQRNQAEDDIEDSDDLPGRVVWVNNNDDDWDNVADFGDGYNLDTANANDDANSDEKSFVRLVFEVSAGLDLAQAQVRITYNASDPAGAMTTTSPPNITTAPGNLRIWTKNGNQVRSSGVIPTGDYVAPGTYDASALGLSNAMRTITLWLEGIRPSAMIGDQRILFEVDPDGPGGAASFCGDAVRVTVSQLEILAWDAPSSSMMLADHVDIGHWGEDRAADELTGYTTGLTGTVINGAGGTFIDVDPDRFIIRLTHLPGNTDPSVVESLTVQVGTLTDAGTVDDADHNITLIETGPSLVKSHPDTGLFLSEPQLLVAPDLSNVVTIDQDDGFPVISVWAPTGVADEATDDRTHKVAINGHVRATYNATGGPCDLSVPVCDRVPVDDRREVRIRVHVFNEPFDDVGYDHDANSSTPNIGAGNGMFDFNDTNGNVMHDAGETSEPYTSISPDGARNTVLGSTSNASAHVAAQIERANQAWAQACIRVTQIGGVIFEEAPADAMGVNVLRDGRFDVLGAATDDRVVIANASGVTHDVLEAYFTAIIQLPPPNPPANAIALPPLVNDPPFNIPVGENSFTFVGIDAITSAPHDIRFRTLAHELGHILTNDFDATNPQYVFFPATTTFQDGSANTYRRTRNDIQSTARKTRVQGDFTPGSGNRLLISVP